MLSLKGMAISDPKATIGICDLPEELLDCIVARIYVDSGNFGKSITPFSLTCRRLRRATLPVLFDTVTIAMGSKLQQQELITQRSLDILGHLAKHSEIADCIRHLRVPIPIRARDSSKLQVKLNTGTTEYHVAIAAFQNLTSLRRVSVKSFDSLVWTLLEKSGKLGNCSLQVTVNGCFRDLKYDSDFIIPAVKANSELRLSTGTWLSLYSHPPQKKGREVDDGPHPTHLFHPVAVHYLGLGYPKVTHQELEKIRSWELIEELHLSQMASANEMNTDVQRMIQGLPKLKRLSVEGAEYTGAVLQIVHKLSQLEGLRLHTGRDRVFHAHLRSAGVQGLPYLDLDFLKTLDIRYISRYLETQRILPSGLRSLRLEYYNRSDRVTSYDLRWMSEHLPQLEILQLNIGKLNNLWHPTAIAGVDVDVEVYQLMFALAGFRNLRKLRLFPTYWKLNNSNLLDFVQPVSDEQAVRIFQHLCRQCRSLQILYISSTTADYAQRAYTWSNIEKPTKWIVRSLGERTVLTTYQAGKDYELEQTWEGERRLTMRTIRHTCAKRYFDDLDDWTLPSYEFDFDEPMNPCPPSRTATIR